ncbi:MAG: NepR family anti-sigma factor [Cypionkella sp.]
MSDSNPKSSIRHQIDENLKLIYAETLNEQIPDKLTKLLEQLRQKSTDPVVEDERE